MSLSSSIDRAVKAYIEHTNVVLSGDASLASLDVSMLQQPFYDLAAPQLAQLALAHQQNDAHGSAPAEVDGKKKRNYKPRDPNAPKRPLTAYFRYLQEQRGPTGEQMAKDNERFAQAYAKYTGLPIEVTRESAKVIKLGGVLTKDQVKRQAEAAFKQGVVQKDVAQESTTLYDDAMAREMLR